MSNIATREDVTKAVRVLTIRLSFMAVFAVVAIAGVLSGAR